MLSCKYLSFIHQVALISSVSHPHTSLVTGGGLISKPNSKLQKKNIFETLCNIQNNILIDGGWLGQSWNILPGRTAGTASSSHRQFADTITEKQISVGLQYQLQYIIGDELLSRFLSKSLQYSISAPKARYDFLQKSMTNDSKSRRFDECQSAEKRESQGTDQTK